MSAKEILLMVSPFHWKFGIAFLPITVNCEKQEHINHTSTWKIWQHFLNIAYIELFCWIQAEWSQNPQQKLWNENQWNECWFMLVIPFVLPFIFSFLFLVFFPASLSPAYRLTTLYVLTLLLMLSAGKPYTKILVLPKWPLRCKPEHKRLGKKHISGVLGNSERNNLHTGQLHGSPA